MPVRLHPIAPDQFVEATKTFAIDIDGDERQIVEGQTRLRGSDPVVRERPDAFVPCADPGIESATAAPGVKRA